VFAALPSEDMTDREKSDRVVEMGNLETTQKFVAELPADELRAFREWFDAFLEQRVDEWLEREVAAGTFDDMARKAIEDDKAGRTRPL
jgi:hypothetical protein